MALKQIKGFTAMELIVVIVILGILVTLTFPRFAAMGEKSFRNEARANLLLIATAEETFQLEQGRYYPPAPGVIPPSGTTETTIANINNRLHLSLNERNWDYGITTTGNPASDYTVYANRQGAGGFLDCQYTLTRDNYQDGNPPVPTVPADCPQ